MAVDPASLTGDTLSSYRGFSYRRRALTKFIRLDKAYGKFWSLKQLINHWHKN